MRFKFFSLALWQLVLTYATLVPLALLPTSSFANSTPLQLRPRVCVPNIQTATCDATIEVRYLRPLTARFCLILDQQKKVYCSNEPTSALQVKIPIQSAANVLFELQDDTGNVIAASTLQVAHHTPPKRVRRGIGWNIL